MAQNMFTHGKKREEYTEADALREFDRVSEALRQQAHLIELPEELSAEHMLSLLDGIEPGETKPARVIDYKKEYAKIIAFAACFVMVIAGFGKLVGKQADMFYAAPASESYLYSAAAAAGETGGTSSQAMVMKNELAEAEEEPAAKSAPADSAPAESAVFLATVQDSGVIPADGADEKLLMLNGTLYRNAGETAPAYDKAAANDKITLTAAKGETPDEEGESNFGTGFFYLVDNGSVIVFVDGEPLVFRK